ncbi:Hypothetical protein FKW44_008896, partial [Caligus rogercresseyi]
KWFRGVQPILDRNSKAEIPNHPYDQLRRRQTKRILRIKVKTPEKNRYGPISNI